MFSYISGRFAAKGDNFAVIDVGGIGYKVYTPVAELGQVGEGLKLYTYLHLREGIMDLYGFVGKAELGLFERLIEISGVGPKAALAILSALSARGVYEAVSKGDHKALARAPGVGARISQRIVLELKGRLTEVDGGELAGISHRAADNDAVAALVALGYSEIQARQAAAASEADSVEGVIRDALRALSAQ